MNHLSTLKNYGARLFQKRAAHEQDLNFASSITQFQKRRSQAVGKGEKALSAIREDLKSGERAFLETRLEQLYSAFDLVELTDEAMKLLSDNRTPAKTEIPVCPNYLISSWFLADCLNFLTSNPHGHERLHPGNRH